MKKLKKHYLMNNYIFLSLALCLSSFGYAAEQGKAKETPTTFEQFDQLPNELQFQILLTRAIDDINESATLEEAIRKVSALLRVDRLTKNIVESSRFVSQIMPALFTLISKSEKGIQTLASLFNVPFIKAGLEGLQKNTETNNFISALLAIDSIQEPLLAALLEITKNTIGKEYKGIQFATGINLNAYQSIMQDLLNNKLYQQALLSDNFLQEIGIDKKSMIQQLLYIPSEKPGFLEWAKELIDQGANPNHSSNSKLSPIGIALINKNLPVLTLFLQRRGKITAETFRPFIQQQTVGPTLSAEDFKHNILENKPEIKKIIDKHGDQETKSFFYGKQD